MNDFFIGLLITAIGFTITGAATHLLGTNPSIAERAATKYPKREEYRQGITRTGKPLFILGMAMLIIGAIGAAVTW